MRARFEFFQLVAGIPTEAVSRGHISKPVRRSRSRSQIQPEGHVAPSRVVRAPVCFGGMNATNGRDPFSSRQGRGKRPGDGGKKVPGVRQQDGRSSFRVRLVHKLQFRWQLRLRSEKHHDQCCVRGAREWRQAPRSGCWTDVLKRCGVDDAVLNGKNQPCPMCGGTDRFQYTDKFGVGNYICRGCGPGDGFKLLEGVMHIDFKEAFKRVQEVVGSDVALNQGTRREPSSDYMKNVSKQIWEEAKPVTAGDDVDRYLRGRGLGMEQYPGALRCHPALGFYIKKPGAKKATLVRNYPAMIAPLQAEDGHATTVHRTYLENGKKAAVA